MTVPCPLSPHLSPKIYGHTILVVLLASTRPGGQSTSPQGTRRFGIVVVVVPTGRHSKLQDEDKIMMRVLAALWVSLMVGFTSAHLPTAGGGGGHKGYSLGIRDSIMIAHSFEGPQFGPAQQVGGWVGGCFYLSCAFVRVWYALCAYCCCTVVLLSVDNDIRSKHGTPCSCM